MTQRDEAEELVSIKIGISAYELVRRLAREDDRTMRSVVDRAVKEYAKKAGVK